MNAWIIGGGLAAAATAYELRQHGCSAHVFEQDEAWGGLVRSRRMRGVIYEPHGSHIFHTDDEEVWDLVSGLVPFNSYAHTVRTMVKGKGRTWPLQRDEMIEMYGYETLAHHDAIIAGATPGFAPKNFEEFCLDIMPPEVYDDFVAPYTEKQWGRPASELSADFAPKRVQVRDDGDVRLFKDAYQGFPDGRIEFSWEDLLVELFGPSLSGDHMHMNVRCTLDDCLALLKRHPPVWRPDVIVVTVPLDDFCGNAFGELSWRGLRFEHKFIDCGEDDTHQGYMVVNWPGKEFAWIRTHETKVASGQRIRGTVLTTEFPGGPARYYPVPGRDGKDRKLNERYAQHVRESIEKVGPKVLVTGRLATFRYLDTDDVIREAIDSVREIMQTATTKEGST